MADIEAPNDTVEHAAGVFAQILDNEKKDAEGLAANPPPPEPKEPPSRFALPGRPEVEPEPESPPEEPVAQVEGAEVPATPAQAAPETPKPAIQTDSQQEAQLQAQRNQYIQQIHAAVLQLTASVQSQFSDIKSYDDLERVAATDPDRYNRYVIAQGRLQEATRLQQTVQQQAQQAQMQQFQKWQQAEQERLPKLVPELADPEKAPEFAAKLRSYALKQGYTEQQLVGASASDFATLRKAMLYEASEAQRAADAKAHAEELKKAQAKAAVAPPVQKPGAQRPSVSREDQIQTDFRRLRKSGSVDDAAALFKRMGV